MSDSVIKRVNGDAMLRRRGKGIVATVLVEVGTKQHLLRIVDGEITQLEQGPFVMPSHTFSISAPAQEWHLFWQTTPPPGAHDLFALIKRGVMKVSGELHPFMANLTYFKGVMKALKAQK